MEDKKEDREGVKQVVREWADKAGQKDLKGFA